MFDPESVDIAVFEAAALLAGLQVPIVAVLLDLYHRTGKSRYRASMLLSAISSIVFLVVAVFSLLLLLQTIWSPAYPGTDIGIVILIVGALVLIGTILVTAGFHAGFDPDLPSTEPKTPPPATSPSAASPPPSTAPTGDQDW